MCYSFKYCLIATLSFNSDDGNIMVIGNSEDGNSIVRHLRTYDMYYNKCTNTLCIIHLRQSIFLYYSYNRKQADGKKRPEMILERCFPCGRDGMSNA